MTFLVFVFRRNLCWFSLNCINKGAFRNENARKRYRVHVALENQFL